MLNLSIFMCSQYIVVPWTLFYYIGGLVSFNQSVDAYAATSNI